MLTESTTASAGETHSDFSPLAADFAVVASAGVVSSMVPRSTLFASRQMAKPSRTSCFPALAEQGISSIAYSS